MQECVIIGEPPYTVIRCEEKPISNSDTPILDALYRKNLQELQSEPSYRSNDQAKDVIETGFTLLIWVLIIVAIIAAARWAWRRWGDKVAEKIG